MVGLFLSKQLLLRLIHLLEVETVKDALHKSLYAVVAEITDTSLVSVVDILVRSKLASLDIQTYLPRSPG